MDVLCDCCKREILARIENDKIVITARRHGQKHVAVIPIKVPKVDKEAALTIG